MSVLSKMEITKEMVEKFEALLDQREQFEVNREQYKSRASFISDDKGWYCIPNSYDMCRYLEADTKLRALDEAALWLGDDIDEVTNEGERAERYIRACGRLLHSMDEELHGRSAWRRMQACMNEGPSHQLVAIAQGRAWLEMYQHFFENK